MNSLRVKGYYSFRMRMGKRLLWLLLMVAALVIPALSGQVVAQEARADLVLNVLPGSYYKEIIPGEESTLYLEIRNDGNQAITDIKLISDNPREWDVDLRPDSIDYLDVGNSQTIDVLVTAPSGIGKGRYTLTLIAEASQTRAVTSVVLRVERSASYWIWVGVGLAVVAIATFIIIFLRLGRDG